MVKSAAEKQNEILEIQMLGDFSLRRGDYVLSGDTVRGKQIWSLLEYILVNRHNEISMDGLIQALWSDDEIEDPANALKNLAYRLRAKLKKSLGEHNIEYIIFKHGAYAWNKAVPCIIDADEMEAAYKAARQNNLSKDMQLSYYGRVVDIYKGNFMPQSSFKEWVAPFTVHYQRIYMESVAKYCELLLERAEYQKVEEVCRRAIAIDPFVEVNHALLIKAFSDSRNLNKAIDHYNYVSKLYYDELGVRPSDLITEPYLEAVKKGAAIEQDITSIKEGLKETNDVKGAIYCNYEEFKIIYRRDARAAMRSGNSAFIAVLNVKEKGGRQISKSNFDENFEKIKNAIVSSLRKDDIVTRYGRTQFLLILSNLTYENSNMVLQRLVKKINESGIKGSFEVIGQVQPLDPIELEENHDTD